MNGATALVEEAGLAEGAAVRLDGAHGGVEHRPVRLDEQLERRGLLLELDLVQLDRDDAGDFVPFAVVAEDLQAGRHDES
ncbi:hypothetical protein ACIGCZ_29245 [Streptomyces nigra]|uniref:hypothetical protein n=1 Tax=Streptomyces nigra TaxID=1827580 RepID=UPI0037D036AD